MLFDRVKDRRSQYQVSQVVRAGWNNFRAMVTGYEVVGGEEGQHG